MAYEKQEWKPRVGTGKNRFRKSNETEEFVELTNEPVSITDPGTPFSTESMNRIEQGIADAHGGLETETAARAAADQGLSARIDALTPEGLDNIPELLAQKMDKSGGTFTGTVKIPSKTSAAANDGTLIATEAQVYNKANIASPIFTGKPQISISGTNYPIACYSEATASNTTVFPLGAYILYIGKAGRNDTAVPRISGNASTYEDGTGSALAGTWRGCGAELNTATNLLRRTA